MGQLSGHLPTVDGRNIQPKEKESVFTDQVQAKGPLSGHLQSAVMMEILKKRKRKSILEIEIGTAERTLTSYICRNSSKSKRHPTFKKEKQVSP